MVANAAVVRAGSRTVTSAADLSVLTDVTVSATSSFLTSIAVASSADYVSVRIGNYGRWDKEGLDDEKIVYATVLDLGCFGFSCCFGFSGCSGFGGCFVCGICCHYGCFGCYG